MTHMKHVLAFVLCFTGCNWKMDYFAYFVLHDTKTKRESWTSVDRYCAMKTVLWKKDYLLYAVARIVFIEWCLICRGAKCEFYRNDFLMWNVQVLGYLAIWHEWLVNTTRTLSVFSLPINCNVYSKTFR